VWPDDSLCDVQENEGFGAQELTVNRRPKIASYIDSQFWGAASLIGELNV